MLSGDTAFVLLEDARDGGGAARCYRAPVDVIIARSLDEVAPALLRIRAALAGGHHVAGFLGYDAGHALEPRLAGLVPATPPDAPPLLWFGVFAAVELIDADAVAALLSDPRGAWAGAAVPRISRARYDEAYARVAGYIAAGDIYQASLSFRADVAFAGPPLALYARLRAASAAGWGGIVFTGSHWLLSASPELFFTLTKGVLTARPMKGTAPRGATPAEDAAAAAGLLADPKERAENLMIVDLLRNDLARVALPGSVAVPALFTLESYPTLHTLTSTVTARIDPRCDAVDALRALFPCGSVTGAPKIRAMAIIAEVEADARGAYTGSIGWLAPSGDAAFNVAIRTLAIDADAARRGHGSATLGLGSAVVADSVADREWAECLAKGAFVARGAGEDFGLIETMRIDADGTLADLARHVARLRTSAAALGFRLPADLGGRLRAAASDFGAAGRLRAELARDGGVAIATGPLPATPAEPVTVALAPLPVHPLDFRLRHKTSDRAFYDDARIASGAFEILFTDRDGLLTEGSFTTLFVEHAGRLLTPPLGRGLLPGILRQRLIEGARAREADVTPAMLADGFLIGNALRGLIRARLAENPADSLTPPPRRSS